MEKQQISLEIPFQEKISRLFIFRWLWAIPLYPVIAVWGIAVGLLWIIHFFYQLILGKRHKWMWTKQKELFVFITNWQTYFQLLVDERPKI